MSRQLKMTRTKMKVRRTRMLNNRKPKRPKSKRLKRYRCKKSHRTIMMTKKMKFHLVSLNNKRKSKFKKRSNKQKSSSQKKKPIMKSNNQLNSKLFHPPSLLLSMRCPLLRKEINRSQLLSRLNRKRIRRKSQSLKCLCPSFKSKSLILWLKRKLKWSNHTSSKSLRSLPLQIATILLRINKCRLQLRKKRCRLPLRKNRKVSNSWRIPLPSLQVRPAARRRSAAETRRRDRNKQMRRLESQRRKRQRPRRTVPVPMKRKKSSSSPFRQPSLESNHY